MPSGRDKCFKESVEKLKDAGKLKKLRVQDQQRWVRQQNTGQWSQTSEVWYKVVGAVSRARKLPDKWLPVPAGAPDATRVPDMTVTPEGGNPIVIDNKFDGDEWRPGQKEDYNEINRQSGNPDAKDLQLNSQVCKCNEEGATDPVLVPKVDFVGIPAVSPVSPTLRPLQEPIVEGTPAGIPLGEPLLVP